MAYQNRIDLTVEAFKGLNNRASNVANGLKIFDDQANLINNIYEIINKKSLIKRIPQNIEYVSGIPGTQYDAIKRTSKMLDTFFSESNSIECNAKERIDSSRGEYLESLSKINSCLSNICANSRQIDIMKNEMKEYKQTLPSKLAKYQKSINNIISKNAKIKKSIETDAVNLMTKITSIRNGNPNYKISVFVNAAEKCMNGISQNSDIAVQLIKKQFCSQKKVLQIVINANKEIIDKCNKLSNKIVSNINKINFQNDFQNYVDKYKINRYDILPEPFVPLDFNHECFSNISTITNVLSLNIYPFAMAKIKKDFNAMYKNELPMQKGKMVLLMEDINFPWVFVQNPYTKKMGYAPSSFLEKIGYSLGVLLTEVATSEEILNKGDYVAIEGNDNLLGEKIVRTISGLNTKIPSSNIGIISEF